MTSQKEINPYDILETKLRYLSYTALNPMQTSLKARLFSGILVGILFLTVVATGIYCCTMSFDVLGDVIINLVVFGAIWQMILKTSFVYFKSKKLSNLLNRMYNDFWQPDSLNLNEKQIQTLQLIYKVASIIDFSLTIGVTLSITGHCTTSILQGNHNMPVNIWLPKQIRFLIDTSPYYRFMQAFQSIYMTASTLSCVLQTDLFITIVIAMILAQFKMLKYKLVLVGDLETKREQRQALSKIINHHRLLCQMLDDIEELFSPMVLQLLGTSMFLVVISFLTALFIDEIPKKLLFGIVGSSGFSQFSLYCVLGQCVQDESISVSDVAYCCNWEKTYDTDMRKTILIIIQRSQKQINITMGKFMILNLENLTRVSRAMLSFFTFVINMKTE